MSDEDRDPGRLPPEAEAVIAHHEQRKLQDAVDHQLRRNLLRLLHELTPPCTVEEIIESNPDLLAPGSRSEIAYHVLVLEKNGAIEETGHLVTATREVKMYVSAVSDDSLVLEVLAMTAKADGFEG
jgi:hypothetical protein